MFLSSYLVPGNLILSNKLTGGWQEGHWSDIKDACGLRETPVTSPTSLSPLNRRVEKELDVLTKTDWEV